MDSFYDEPRRVPVPMSVDQIPACQLVPEVSILVPNNGLLNQSKNVSATKPKSYEAWKTQNQKLQSSSNSRCNKENNPSYMEFDQYQQGISKISSGKHVRFNSPQMQKEVLKTNINACSNVNSNCKSNNLKSNSLNRPFEEIYLANMPNRNLDLSIIEPVSYKPHIPEDDRSKTYNTNQVYLNDKVTRRKLENTNSINASNGKFLDSVKVAQQECDYKSQRHLERWETNHEIQRIQYTHPSYNSENKFPSYLPPNKYSYNGEQNKEKNSDDPSVKDLLKVVQQQNEQILLLQKQVALLLQNQANQKQIEAPPIEQTAINSRENYMNAPQCNAKGTVSKFAIDVMTSFEVSVRQPPNIPRNKLNKDTINPEAKILEITEGGTNGCNSKETNCDNILGDIKANAKKDKNRQQSDVSFALNESVQVMERCPSPENSIHVDMQDYSSDSDDDSTSSTDVGWTIYNNVMGQVNNILKKANNNMKDFACGPQQNASSKAICDKTLRRVKEATMRHLKSIGVNLPIIEEPDLSQKSTEMVNGSEYTPTEISFAVKQLLMKYLPDDQLVKVTQPKPTTSCKKRPDASAENLIKRRPEFSFATLEYMKKYNLLTSDSVEPEVAHQNRNAGVQKILDVTALKQQPKLL